MSTPHKSTQQPNIVLMISHDLGCHFGPYGFAVEQSHQLNQLASDSMRFDAHFVTSPGCSQSRSSLVTGRYPHSNGQFGLAHLGWTLDHAEILLPTLLRNSGYHTTLFGIWHLHKWTLTAFDTLSEDVATSDSSPEGFAEVASNRTAKWLTNAGRYSQPFYLHVGFWETHRPFCGNEAQATSADSINREKMAVPDYLPNNEPTQRELAELHQSVSLVDQGVGRILHAIESTGLSENTMVLFTADHGLAFPRAKGTLYDPGIQVGLLARWPERIPGRTTTARLTSNLDVAPTVLELAGLPVPECMQGHSFANLLDHTASPEKPRDAVFAEKTYHEHYDPIRCIRTNRYKFIRNFADRPNLVLPSDVYNSPTRKSITNDEAIWGPRPREELYDLDQDPGENDNLADNPQYAHTRAQLSKRLSEWMRQTDDPLLNGDIPRPRE